MQDDVDPGRRALVAALGLTAAAGPVMAAAPDNPADPTETIRLWPDRPPGSPAALPDYRIIDRTAASGFLDRVWERVAEPILTVFRPARPNGAAMLVVPGGGYVRVVIDKEGFETARRLNAAGVTAFVLRYRLPADGWARRSDVPLQDGQRAMRLIRANAARYGLDPGRVAAIGFSAGGHLTASLSTRHDAKVYESVDAADRLSARPDLVALAYPVITMAPPFAHAGSALNLLGEAPSTETVAAYSPDRRVDAGTPPTFLFHAADDTSVPVENSLAYFAALRAAKVPGELHVFEEGGHGFGIRQAQGLPAAAWPDLFLAWAAQRGFPLPT
jgi:acetyl esterase/lipase